jgi:hypothetical protein
MDQSKPSTEQKETEVLKQVRPHGNAGMFWARLMSHKSLWLFVIVAVFGFFLAAALFAFFSGSKKIPKTPAISAAPAVVVPAAPVAAVIETPASEVPVEPANAIPLPALSLSGILYSEHERLALINGKVIPEGGTVEGVKVEKIGTDEVELSFEGQKITLRSR